MRNVLIMIIKAAMTMSDETSSGGKCRVVCIPPEEELGFLINLPAPCNLLFQPPPEVESKYFSIA